ncbi:hypothetical protein [Nonomuraea sp. CA-141351]|uniref:hypothetical protein n=1 Tax=Nonomuraea sp. CA-141351 TaxID=3239996 RepID=UPI003D8B1459
MPGLVKELRRARTEQVHPDDFEEMASWEVGDLLDTLAGALLLTGVGVITGPAAAVTWMTGRGVNRRWAEDPRRRPGVPGGGHPPFGVASRCRGPAGPAGAPSRRPHRAAGRGAAA